MNRKTDSLVFKLTIVFLLITLLSVGISGYLTYKEQYHVHLEQSKAQIQSVSHYLRDLVEEDADEFPYFRDYLIEHRDDLYLPIDFDTDCSEEEYYYHNLLSTKYPGKELGVDYSYEDFDEETYEAFTIYNYVYWTDVFWKAEEAFGVPYTMLLYPDEENDSTYYVIDALRTPTEGDESRLQIADYIYEPRDERVNFWQCWETGKEPDGFDVSDNEYGHTYAFYTPIYIEGELAGIVATEIDVDTLNADILKNIFHEMLIVSIIMILSMLVLIIIIYNLCVVKLVDLQENVQRYTTEKNPAIAEVILSNTKGRNEITALSEQVADMIKNLDSYMTTLTQTVDELKATQKKATELGIQAERDSLTGIRNKTAYDNEVQLIEWHMHRDNFKKFGIAMVDLNYLKKINDTYGHEKGNLTIKKLCTIVCSTFAHSPVFRVGGDEFVVILQNSDYDEAEVLVKEFKDIISESSSNETLDPWERVSAAIGWTFFDPNTDVTVQNVFKRADDLMYENKKAMRANRE